MFNLLNQVNLSLHGRDANFLLCQNRVTAFVKKFNVCKTRINGYVLDMFSILCDYIANNPSINTIFPDV